MHELPTRVDNAVQSLLQTLLSRQSADGSWRLGVENGVMTDAYFIVLLRSLNRNDDEKLIADLVQRLLDKQNANGAWTWYTDEAGGHLSATVEAYCALLHSGMVRPSDERMQRAKRFILAQGGLGQVSGALTKAMLATWGHYPWPAWFRIPAELMLLPESFTPNFYDFSVYARAHLTPVMILMTRRYTIQWGADAPDLSDLSVPRTSSGSVQDDRADWAPYRGILEDAIQGLKKLALLPQEAKRLGLQRAERFMLEHIEPDGTLYSYASSTFLMIYALLALDYSPDAPVIQQAVAGLKSLIHPVPRASGFEPVGGGGQGNLHVQNFNSTVWDTALVSYAMQEAGVPPKHPAIQHAAGYLLRRQHTRLGDWSRSVRHPVPGGWGFSDINTMNPDVDDTTAALRTLHYVRSSGADPRMREAISRGLHWVLSMQNADGGWPAFERGKDSALLAKVPIEGAASAATDPSTADLTGRALDYLGACAGLTLRHPLIQRGVDWLVAKQERDGSWYGRWGVCYVYGTWAAVTGMMAVGTSPSHPSIQRAVSFLLNAQRVDGGWGESCRSDQLHAYIPLAGGGTPSQTAWALDALIAVHDEPLPAITRGVEALVALLHRQDWTAAYPTGAGLPSAFYNRYFSYNLVWPLVALSHYRRRYGLA
ncbi:terpene cyclase/mutase family protein [Paenibacillus cremeus]|uniref:Squalene--hopene cyclase n=1 Tax=Paenibacillus cremeus TaxID=2163881 RepID=A0A559K8H0_9BACL|nr:prenyltransferase/squalene oxidase repeat-containing protein [Paenibacillus cremeus]TVY08436.1 squalene--hopene cyclase [Paenibacillus cremeus]